VIYDIRHKTRVDYAAPVRLARFNLRLRPAPWPTQTVRDFRLTVAPVPWTMEEEAGPFLVNRSRLFIREPIDALEVESRFRVDVRAPDPELALAKTPSVAEIGARRRPSRPIRAWPGQLHLSLVDDRAFARDRRLGQPDPGRRTQRDGCRAGADACHPRGIHL
jgi:transglutaminase-like putative cysteine protease